MGCIYLPQSGIISYLDRKQALRDTSASGSKISKMEPLIHQDSKTRRQFLHIVCDSYNTQSIKYDG